MKLIDKSKVDFDNKLFTVQVTGREVAHVYAALMNLNGDNFYRTAHKAGYNGEPMINTDELDTQSWFDLIVNNQS